MLTAAGLRGLYAIIPTPAKAGADRWDATDTVDLDETARVVDRLIRDGAAGLIALGTTGECPTLTEDEYAAFVDCVLGTVKRRVPTFVGATALGLHQVVRRLRLLRELGADGTLLGLPMWQPCTVDMAVRYYAAVSEGFPELAVMVYANQRAFRFDFPADFWRRIAEGAPTVVAAKFSNPGRLLEVQGASGRRINFVPNDSAVLEFARLSPDTTTACWATAASMGPQPSLAIIDAILRRDSARAEQIDADIKWANEPIRIITVEPQEFASYNIQMEKLRIDAAGYCRAGPIRPPYDVMPEAYAAAARECGRRWAELCQKYATAGAGNAARTSATRASAR